MSKPSNTKWSERSPIITIFESIVIALCIVASVVLIFFSLPNSLLRGGALSFSDLLLYADFTTALGLMFLVVVYIIIKVINFLFFIKPLKKMQKKADSYKKSLGELIVSLNAVKGEVANSDAATGSIQDMTGEHALSLNKLHNDLSNTSMILRKLFGYAANIDNAALQLRTNFEVYENKIIGALGGGAYAQAGAYDSEDDGPGGAATGYGADGDEAGGPAGFMAAAARADGTAGYTAAAQAGDPAGFTAAAQAGGLANPASADDNDISADLLSQQKTYLDMLTNEGETISIKVKSFLETIRNAIVKANRLSLYTAIECAKAGEAGRGFANIADDIRSGAEVLSEAVPAISEVLDDMEAQAAVLAELKSMNDGWAKAHSGGAPAPDAAYAAAGPYGAAASDPSDTEARFKMYREVRERLNDIRTAIRNFGAALAETSESVASEARLVDNMLIENNDILDRVGALASILGSIDEKLSEINAGLK